MKTLINYKGLNFDIVYHYTEPTKGDWDTPPTDAVVEIEEISHNGTNFTDFLIDEFEQIEKQVLNEHIDF